jgi:hypothetical protein
MGYPSAPRSSATDHFINLKSGLVKIPNPYKWLEDATSPYKKYSSVPKTPNLKLSSKIQI